MGGMVANYLTGEYPERVEAVVLLGPVEASPSVAKVFEERIGRIKNGEFGF